MQKTPSRWEQAFNKLLFCIRVTADLKTGLRLMLNSKRFSRYQKKNAGPDQYKKEQALPYAVHYLFRNFMLYLRTYTGDIQMFYEIFLEQVYRLPASFLAGPSANPSTSSGLSSGPPLVIVDAGANVGMATKYFSLVYPSARIFCIEPDPRNFKWLQKNLEEEQAEGRVIMLEAALYERDGRIGLEEDGWSFNSKVSESGGQTLTIPAYTMKRFLDQFGLEKVDLLKMDIEGAEEGLFQADTHWLAGVDAILIEIHRPKGVELIKGKLEGQGFRWYPWCHSTSAASLFLASRKELTGNS